MFECEFCKNKFSSVYNLNNHQKTASYCLKIQGKPTLKNLKCSKCQKSFTTKRWLIQHELKCGETIENLKKKIEKYEKKIEDLNKIIKSQEEYEDKFMDLLYSYQNLAELYVQDGKDNINKLNKKYLKRHKRTKYPGENVIYVLTTSSLKKDRRYILGKAVNLTKRLSTYNKSDEHEVIFYASCPNKEKMSLVESMVFDKLCKCRERANRERFILPGDEDINLFSETIKDCINFVS